MLPKTIYRYNAIPYQVTHDIFHRTRTNNPRIYMEPWKTQNCQSNFEEREQSRRHNHPRLQIILQKHSNQSVMILSQKKIWINRKESWEVNPHTYSQFSTQEVRIYNGERQPLQQGVLGKLDSCMKSAVRTHPPTIHKNKLKDLNIRHDTIKLEHRQHSLT